MREIQFSCDCDWKIDLSRLCLDDFGLNRKNAIENTTKSLRKRQKQNRVPVAVLFLGSSRSCGAKKEFFFAPLALQIEFRMVRDQNFQFGLNQHAIYGRRLTNARKRRAYSDCLSV